MERLFTSITNAGQTATHNENIMLTGYYAGEREDFMRENYYMSETTMAPVKIALDHGWSSIKGEHTFMETSVVPVDYEPLTKNGLLEYKGKKYIVGQGRLGNQATKTENENYFLLTLAGIAREFCEFTSHNTILLEISANYVSVLVSDLRGARLCTGGEMQNLHLGKVSAVSGSIFDLLK